VIILERTNLKASDISEGDTVLIISGKYKQNEAIVVTPKARFGTDGTITKIKLTVRAGYKDGYTVNVYTHRLTLISKGELNPNFLFQRKKKHDKYG
jgi:hypothetical protein